MRKRNLRIDVDAEVVASHKAKSTKGGKAKPADFEKDYPLSARSTTQSIKLKGTPSVCSSRRSRPPKHVRMMRKSKSTVNLTTPPLHIGFDHEAPEFMVYNKHITRGYRINFNSYRKIFKSLFMIHNETINVWTHLLGLMLFTFLIA